MRATDELVLTPSTSLEDKVAKLEAELKSKNDVSFYLFLPVTFHDIFSS